jgi:hypothetical protein
MSDDDFNDRAVQERIDAERDALRGQLEAMTKRAEEAEALVGTLEGHLREIQTFLNSHFNEPDAGLALLDYLDGNCSHGFMIDDDVPGMTCCILCGHPGEVRPAHPSGEEQERPEK